MTGELLLAFLLAYLIGGIPFGVLAAKSKGIDIFAFGSGNPGATNVSRALGKTWGAAVFATDVLKGTLPALVARAFFPHALWGVNPQAIWFVVGLFAVIGHCASPFLGFRGGKGIATSLGAGLGACPVVALLAFGIFFLVLAVTRYVSLASVVSVPIAALLQWMIPSQARELVPVFAALAVFVAFRHRGNMKRILEGSEPKVGKKKSPE